MCLFQGKFRPDICPTVGLPGHMVAVYLVFSATSILFSMVVVPIYIPTNMIGGFSFLICRLFDDGYSDWCEVRPHCSFYVHFSHNYLHLASFHVLFGNHSVFGGMCI